MNSENILINNYKRNLKILVILICSFIIICVMTSKISQDYNNIKYITIENDFINKYDDPYLRIPQLIVNKYFLTKNIYFLGISFLGFTIFMLSQEILKDYRLLNKQQNKK